MNELKSVYIDRNGDWCRSGNNTGDFYLRTEVDELVSKLKEQISTERSAKVDYHISANDYKDGLAKAYDENRRLNKALCLARAWRAWCEQQFWLVIESSKPRDVYHLSLTNRIHRTPNEWITFWYKIAQFYKKKVEEYRYE